MVMTAQKLQETLERYGVPLESDESVYGGMPPGASAAVMPGRETDEYGVVTKPGFYDVYPEDGALTEQFTAQIEDNLEPEVFRALQVPASPDPVVHEPVALEPGMAFEPTFNTKGVS